jgi:cytochrome c oxidase subunit II
LGRALRTPRSQQERARPRGGAWGRARLAVLLGATAALAAACAPDAPMDALQPAGEIARQKHSLWTLVFWIAVAVFVIVEGVLVYALVKFRHKPGRRAAQFHGNTRVEVILVLLPALLLTFVAVPTVTAIFDLDREPEEEALEMTVVGRQFWWEFHYPEELGGFATANEMHIPAGTPIRLTLEGDILNRDVIHSFWVPRLGGKQDVIPGRVNHMTLEADEPGEYRGQCAEFCGLSHANMRLMVIAHEQADFESWAAAQAEPARAPVSPLAQRGEQLFVEGSEAGTFAAGPPCAACHTIDGLEGAAGTMGPNLTHVASRDTFGALMFEFNEENLRTWLRDPPAMKPGVRMPDLGLTGDEIDALVAYLRTLE